MLISKTVKVKWHPNNKKHYESLGYKWLGKGEEFEVKIEHLMKGSGIEIICSCDNCGEELIKSYINYNKEIDKNCGKIYCKSCGIKLVACPTINKNKIKNGESKSFYDWCIENNRQDILDRWDYELNGCSPKDIRYNSNKKYWFKCNKHPEHKSESKRVVNFVKGEEGVMDCKQCNSIAQYILDNFPNKDLYDVWDKERNENLDPWDIPKGSKVKVWIKCQDKDYHGSYEIRCFVFSKGSRCTYCVGKKVHRLDSMGQYIIDKYGEELLWKIWSDKNEISPFEVSIYSHKKVWWNCPDDKHESFERSCAKSVKYEFRCPECSKEREESMIEEKTRLYLEELGYKVLTEHNCTIRPTNPKTKQPLPFDNEIILENGKHLIIEVHGGQHYDHIFFMTTKKITKEEAEKELHYQQVKDRYKRIKCIQSGYEYLEIPYWAFDNNDTYKKLIDDKIEGILMN